MSTAPRIGQTADTEGQERPAGKLTMNRDYCIWVVPPKNGRVRKVRLSWRHIVCAVIVTSAVSSAVFVIAGDYVRAQASRAKSYLNTRRMVNQLESFKAQNEELSSKLESLSSAQQRLQQYETDVRKKVGQLGEILEAATSIGLVDSEGSGSVVPEGDGAESDRADAGENKTGGIGGLELDCTGLSAQACIDSIAEGEIGSELDDKKIVRGGDFASERLVNTLNGYISLLKSVPLGYPVSGEITSGFGCRISPFVQKVKMHQGVDFSLPRGSYIYATAFGIVKTVERNGTYGLRVDIDHGSGVITRYAHLSRALVKEGQEVKRGQIVGHVGSTGRSTGPHLHYEIRMNDRAKNPNKFMDLAYRLNSILQ